MRDPLKKIDAREMLRDAIGIAGVAALCGGVGLEFGAGWALVTLGAVLLALVLVPRRA